MASYIPKRGDIIYLDFDPSAGTEIMKRRPAIVLSAEVFNKITGLVFVAPITSTVRGHSLEVEIKTKSVQGVALLHQVRSLDFNARNAKKTAVASAAVIKACLDTMQVIFS